MAEEPPWTSADRLPSSRPRWEFPIVAGIVTAPSRLETARGVVPVGEFVHDPPDAGSVLPTRTATNGDVFESLDFPTPPPPTSTPRPAHYRDWLGAELVFRVRAMGTAVAALA